MNEIIKYEKISDKVTVIGVEDKLSQIKKLIDKELTKGNTIILFDTEFYLPLQYYINDINKMVIFSLDFIAVLGAAMRMKDSLEQLKESILSYKNGTVIISTDIKYKSVFKELSTKFVEICNSKIEIYRFTNLEEIDYG